MFFHIIIFKLTLSLFCRRRYLIVSLMNALILSPRMKKCLVCKHTIDRCGASHAHCRSHAPCARGWRYLASECSVCNQLFESANNIEDIDAAVSSYLQLRLWIQGFVKNSRKRPRGIPVFVDMADREELESIEVVIRNLRDE